MPFRLNNSWTAPALCLLMLVGAGWVQRDLRGAQSFEPYHARVRAAIAAIPTKIDTWDATEQPLPRSALALLKPNAIRSFSLQERTDVALRRPDQPVYMTIVQCKRASDMLGHYPPNCYPAIGDTLRSSYPRTWQVDGLDITGTEYEFERLQDGKTRRRIVYSFMVVPGKGFAPDMKALEFAADDYQQRYYGAAQFQVVFDSLAGQGRSQAERDEVFTTLITAAAPAIREVAKP
ncbi:MAG: hypothetical protein QM770_05580 [Tepidisphaeraceae bacterium]